MDFINFIAGQDDDGRRLDKILKKIFQDTHGISIYSALRKNLIKVNGKKTSAESKIASGDKISVASFLLNSSNSPENSNEVEHSQKDPEKLVLPEMIFRNEHLLFLNKPYGINVQNARKEEISLAVIVKKYFAPQNSSSISFEAGPLHRLDKNTTGLIAFSQSLKGAQWFSEGIRNHTIRKHYLGIALGKMEKAERWEDFITEEEETKKSAFHTVKIIPGIEPNAITVAEPLFHGRYMEKDITLCKFSIETGRKHQIRCQSSFHGHALLGDSAYCNDRTELAHREFFLHAFQLEFPANNPLNLPEQIVCPVHEDMLGFMKKNFIGFEESLLKK